MIKGLEGQPPVPASADMLYAMARWLNGNELADRLGLARPSAYYWALVAGQCAFFSFESYVYRSIPYLDKKKIAMLRKAFYHMIVESKHGLSGKETHFEFKYVPEYGLITKMGESEEAKSGKSLDSQVRNLTALFCAVCALTVGGWMVLRAVEATLSVFWH